MNRSLSVVVGKSRLTKTDKGFIKTNEVQDLVIQSVTDFQI